MAAVEVEAKVEDMEAAEADVAVEAVTLEDKECVEEVVLDLTNAVDLQWVVGSDLTDPAVGRPAE